MRVLFVTTLALTWLSLAAAATITVQPGDTFTRLAVRHGTTVNALTQANPRVRQGGLQAGARLTLPVAVNVWTVRRGDTLSTIAQRQGVTLAGLLAANRGLDPQAPLQIGQKLALPSRAAGSSRTTATPTLRTASIRVTAVMPVQGRLTSTFHANHLGLDLAAPTGTPIRAARAGVVTESHFDGRTGWGWTIVVDHGGGMTTRYSHNSANLARVGGRVDAGQVIARVGNTGNSTGPHLDYRVTVQGQPINPLSLY